MENQTWIKLFRKIVDHDIFNDESAFKVFMWILCSCDYKTGTMKSGRFWASQRLGVNPITYYKILKRLEKKYDLVTLESNNKNTTILVKKWSLYQDQSNNESNNKVTTKEQQSNTTQELRIKKKENNIYKHLPEKEEITGEQIEQIAKQYSVSANNVKDIWESVYGYCHSKGEKYANFYATTQNWVRRAIKDKKILVIKQEDDYVRRLNEASR